MASFLLMPNSASHICATSTPFPPHPIILRIENEFHRLVGWEASLAISSSSHPKVKLLCEGLCCLTSIYDCIRDLLQMSLTQQAPLNHQHDKSVEGVLDESLELLDVCSITRDAMMQTKEHVQDLQLLLRRRRGGEKGLENKVVSYLYSTKKKKKEMDKCLKALKRTKCKHGFTPLLNQDDHLVIVINVLREMRSKTIFILESILYFMEVPKQRRKTAGRSLVSKWMRTRQVTSEVEEEGMKNVERAVYASLYPLDCLNSCNIVEPTQEQYTLRLFVAMDVSIQSINDKLDCLFRCLIKTRVSLLNILNH